MFDPMGLNKEPEGAGAPETAPVIEAPARKSARESPGFWFLLMIIDGVFVVFFGGLTAARVFQHWGAPPPAAVRAQPPHPAAKAKAEPPPAKLQPAKPAEAPKPPEPPEPPKPPKPAEAARAPEAVKPPKPSLVQEAPKPREAPKPQQAAPPKPAEEAKAAPSAPAAKVKAAAVEFKLRSKGRKVQVAGAFLVHGGKKDMAKEDGVWSVTVYLNPGTYRYYFIVDGRKVLDPENSKIDRGASVLSVP